MSRKAGAESMPLSEYSQGKLGDDRAIHFGISNVGHRKRSHGKENRAPGSYLTHPGWASLGQRVCKCV